MKTVKESILLKTSSNVDVQCSGGDISITGLRTVSKKDITSIKQVKYRAEVPQVITIGATSYTPANDTLYSVQVGDPNRSYEGAQETLRTYSYRTPEDVSTLGNAAAQREVISAAIVLAINNESSQNKVVALSLGTGSGFTVTDSGSYYPVRAYNMSKTKGPSIVRPSAGYASTNWALTTEAVTSFGVGALLAAQAPTVDALMGNLTSGVLEAPPVTTAGATAVTGQKYDGFFIESLYKESTPTITDRYSYIIRTQSIYVDNGTGTATTNLAGFITFEREMHKLITETYKNDGGTVREFFDQNFIIQGLLGAAPATTTSVLNKFHTPYGMLNHINIGTQTIVAPTQGTTGLLAEQDTTATEGAHYAPSIVTPNNQQFIVGKTAATCVFKFKATTVANIVIMAGFRTKEAFTLDFNDYTNLAAGGTGPSGTDLYAYGILSNAATVATDTTANAADGVAVDVRVQVAINGTVSLYINGTKYPVYSVGTTALVFAADTVIS